MALLCLPGPKPPSALSLLWEMRGSGTRPILCDGSAAVHNKLYQTQIFKAYIGGMLNSSNNYGLAEASTKRASPVAATLIVGGLFTLAALWLWINRTLLPGELISPISPNLFAAAAFVGVFSSLLLAARIMTI